MFLCLFCAKMLQHSTFLQQYFKIDSAVTFSICCSISLHLGSLSYRSNDLRMAAFSVFTVKKNLFICLNRRKNRGKQDGKPIISTRNPPCGGFPPAAQGLFQEETQVIAKQETHHLCRNDVILLFVILPHHLFTKQGVLNKLYTSIINFLSSLNIPEQPQTSTIIVHHPDIKKLSQIFFLFLNPSHYSG